MGIEWDIERVIYIYSGNKNSRFVNGFKIGNKSTIVIVILYILLNVCTQWFVSTGYLKNGY